MSSESIEQLIGEYQSHIRAKKHLKSVQGRIDRENRHLNILSLKLKNQERYYKDLKGLSLSGLVYKFLGQKDEKIESRREEYLKATLRYNESIKTLELLRFEKEVLREKVSKTSHLPRQLQIELAQRIENVHEHFPDISDVLINYDKKIDRLVALRREVREAGNLSSSIQDQLGRLELILSSVIHDETWINSLSKRDIPDDYKINTMLDQALDIAFKLKEHYEQLKVELEDVEEFKLELHLQTQRDIQFFRDQFQEQLLTDWIMEQKLRSVLASIQALKKNISTLVKAFDFQMQENQDTLQRFFGKRTQLIEEYLSQ